MYQAKKIGKTPKGTKYIILQDENILHITIQYGSLYLYDRFSNVSSESELDDNILSLEKELHAKILPPLDS